MLNWKLTISQSVSQLSSMQFTDISFGKYRDDGEIVYKIERKLLLSSRLSMYSVYVRVSFCRPRSAWLLVLPLLLLLSLLNDFLLWLYRAKRLNSVDRVPINSTTIDIDFWVRRFSFRLALASQAMNEQTKQREMEWNWKWTNTWCRNKYGEQLCGDFRYNRRDDNIVGDDDDDRQRCKLRHNQLWFLHSSRHRFKQLQRRLWPILRLLRFIMIWPIKIHAFTSS